MSKKLLLADDSITIQKVIQITFAHEDYELTITDNGDEALAKAQQIRPDLVMADVYMPGKNGYELTTAIKQDPELGHVPVLLLAGSFEPFDEEKARSCQADAWIEKPFESQSLIDKVAELLSAAPAAPVAEAAPDVTEPVAEEAAPTEAPAPDFAEPAPAAPDLAASADDPFADISFAEETPAAEQEVEPEPAVTAADDWSDVAAEAEITEPAAESSQEAEEPMAEPPADDSGFADEPAVQAEEPVTPERTPVVEPMPESFDMDEEIMPLDDDDILGAEDLEPVPQEQTLASWSRDEAAADDVFAEPLEEPAVSGEDSFAPVTEPAPEEEPLTETGTDVPEPPVIEEPAAEEPLDFSEAEEAPAEFGEPAVEEPPAGEEPAPESAPEPEPSVMASSPGEAEPAMADVETKVASLSEADIEQVVEKVVARIVEKMAGSILERVAWEVVPDLAESLIREEIRKIKDAAA